jgi:hypothetical protein
LRPGRLILLNTPRDVLTEGAVDEVLDDPVSSLIILVIIIGVRILIGPNFGHPMNLHRGGENILAENFITIFLHKFWGLHGLPFVWWIGKVCCLVFGKGYDWLVLSALLRRK